MRYLEQNMTTFWLFTETRAGCRAFVDVMHDLSESYDVDSEERGIVEFLRDVAWTKGQLFCVEEILGTVKVITDDFEERQRQQIKEASKAFVGDFKEGNK